MRIGIQGFRGPYQRWAEAQDAVSAYERLVFSPEHQLSSTELQHLQGLRRTAADLLRRLIEDVDDQLRQLRAGSLTMGATESVDSPKSDGPTLPVGLEALVSQTSHTAS